MTADVREGPCSRLITFAMEASAADCIPLRCAHREPHLAAGALALIVLISHVSLMSIFNQGWNDLHRAAWFQIIVTHVWKIPRSRS